MCTSAAAFSTPAAAAPKLLWETKGLAQPESVVQDPATGALYVSNIAGAVMQKDGNGFIAKLRPDGTVVTREWVKGLNAPTGLALHDRTLYAADVDELLEINVASGEIVTRHAVKDGTFEPWLANDALNGPNGLLVLGDKLIVASFGKLPDQGSPELGGLIAVDLKDQSVSKLRDDAIGNLDGLQSLAPGIYLVTDWAAGGLYRVGKGKAERLLKLNKGSADFVYFPDQKSVLVPIMLSNALVAYKLDGAD